MSKLYRKKPVVIEAVRWTGQNVLEVYSFMHGAPTLGSAVSQDKWFDFENIHAGKDWHIKTLEDGPNGEAKHVASVGDWIIKGVQGEFYPCKPDIFDVTYEPADTPSPQPNVAGAFLPTEDGEFNGNERPEPSNMEQLEEIKYLACTAGAPGHMPVPKALARILWLCNRAGVTKKMDDLRPTFALASSEGRG